LSNRLIYLMGASGSGKDSLMQYARDRLAAEAMVQFTHRYITRPVQAGGENHVALSEAEFQSRLQGGLFAMHWFSHGWQYGIGIEIHQWLAKGFTVVVNGSRDYLSTAASRYPELLPVQIEVAPDTLFERLKQRGRESIDDIRARISRHQMLSTRNFGCVSIANNNELSVAGNALVELIKSHQTLPSCR